MGGSLVESTIGVKNIFPLLCVSGDYPGVVFLLKKGHMNIR